MVSEEEKIIICSLRAAADACEAAAAGYRLAGDDDGEHRAKAQSRRHRAEADKVLDGREL